MGAATAEHGTSSRVIPNLGQNDFVNLQNRLRAAVSFAAGMPYLIVMLAGRANWPITEITNFLGVGENTVTQAIEQWQAGGLTNLDTLSRAAVGSGGSVGSG